MTARMAELWLYIRKYEDGRIKYAVCNGPLISTSENYTMRLLCAGLLSNASKSAKAFSEWPIMKRDLT